MEVNKILLGNCLDILKQMPDDCVDCCVTSPPYFGLRDYGTASWVGGDSRCDHTFLPETEVDRKYKNRIVSSHTLRYNRTTCPKCGAIRVDMQIGIESSPDEYIMKLVEIFNEVQRVLKKNGTLWLNIGDTYNGYKGNATSSNFETMYAGHRHQPARTPCFGLEAKNLKQKDLIGVPWMLAFALRENGWYLRQDIIWYKPNPMPESVIDRCTKSHEYIFLLSKSQKYYYDAEAIAEPIADATIERLQSPTIGNTKAPRYGGNKYTVNPDQFYRTKSGNAYAPRAKRNKRDVWAVTTKPFKEAHFATFPQDLIIPCVLAGCPEGGIVLDPFIGSGTTGLVARNLNRNYIGIELNPLYKEIADRRIALYGENLFNQDNYGK